MKLNAWPVLLAAPALLGLVLAYPHRGAYREELEGAGSATEKSIRHIDGLGGFQRVQSQQELEQIMREMENQMNSASNAKWSMKVSEYSSHSGGSGSGAGGVENKAAPIHATITGEAVEGGDAIIGVTANCRNCRMRVRKVGYGGATNEAEGSNVHGSGGSSYGQGSALGLQKVGEMEASQSRYYSSKSDGSYTGGSVAGTRDAEAERTYVPARPIALSAGPEGTGNHIIKTSRVVEQSSVSGNAGRGGILPVTSSMGSDISGSTGSSRKEVKVTKSSWNLADLGYGTSNTEDIMRRLEEDLRKGRFENGKTVTTVTTTSSVNGAAPTVHKETFVKDGFDSSLASGNTMNIGRSEIEDLMQKLREDLNNGRRESGKTVTTVVTTTSVNGETPTVKKETFVKDGFDGSSLDGFGIGSGFDREIGSTGSQSGARKIIKTTHTRKVYTTSTGGSSAFPSGSSFSGDSSSSSEFHKLSSGTSSTGGFGNSHDTRTVDSLGGGHLIREVGLPDNTNPLPSSSSYNGGRQNFDSPIKHESSSSYHKETRRVDRLGGAHLIRDTDTVQATGPSGSSLSVAQMKGYRKNAPEGDSDFTGVGSYARNSKYYSSFDSGSSLNAGVSTSTTGNTAPSVTANEGDHRMTTSYVDSLKSPETSGFNSPSSGGSSSSGHIHRSGSSSSYKKSVSYGSSGDTTNYDQIGSSVNRERDIDRLGGGHLLRDVNFQNVPSSVIQAETQNSKGQIEKHQGQGFSSYSLSISGSGASADGSGRTPSSIPSVPQSPSLQPVSQTDVSGNLAFITAEQGGPRIPEGSSSSYFSSHAIHQKSSSAGSNLAGVNPASPVSPVFQPVVAPVPAPSFSDQREVDSSYGLKGTSEGSHYKAERRVDRLGEGHLIKRVDGTQDGLPAYGSSPLLGTSSSSSTSYSRKVDWSSSGVQTGAAAAENLDESEEEFPLPSPLVPSSPSIKLGYGSGNGGYGGAARSGGQLSTSLLDLGISPSYGNQRQTGYGATGTQTGSQGGYSGYSHGSSSGYSSGRIEQSSAGYGMSSGPSTFSSGTSYGSGNTRYGTLADTALSENGDSTYGSSSHSYRSHSYSSPGNIGSSYQHQQRHTSTQDCEEGQVQQNIPVRP